MHGLPTQMPRPIDIPVLPLRDAQVMALTGAHVPVPRPSRVGEVVEADQGGVELQ